MKNQHDMHLTRQEMMLNFGFRNLCLSSDNGLREWNKSGPKRVPCLVKSTGLKQGKCFIFDPNKNIQMEQFFSIDSY